MVSMRTLDMYVPSGSVLLREKHGDVRRGNFASGEPTIRVRFG